MTSTADDNDDEEHYTPLPLLYSALTTRRWTYPKYIILRSHPLPVLIKRHDLGADNVFRLVVSSLQAIIVPPILNNIAEFLERLLAEEEAPPFFPFQRCYGAIIRVLCSASLPNNQVHLLDAHERIALSGLCALTRKMPGTEAWYHRALIAVKSHIHNRWGTRIRFAAFHDIIYDTYNYLREVRDSFLSLWFGLILTNVRFSLNFLLLLFCMFFHFTF